MTRNKNVYKNESIFENAFAMVLENPEVNKIIKEIMNMREKNRKR